MQGKATYNTSTEYMVLHFYSILSTVSRNQTRVCCFSWRARQAGRQACPFPWLLPHCACIMYTTLHYIRTCDWALALFKLGA